MESLKMYIKDKRPITFFYNVGFAGCIVFLGFTAIEFFGGEVNRTTIKAMMAIPLMPIAGWYFLSEAKNLFLVFKDYKKQILVTNTFKIKKADYEACFEPVNGAYFKVKFYNDKHEYWLYKRSQIYSEFVNNEEYEVTYYKYSRCIHSIKRLTFNYEHPDEIVALKRSKKKKLSKRKVSKKPPRTEPFEIFILNYMDGFVVDILLILTIPFYVMLCNSVSSETWPGVLDELFVFCIPLVIVFYVAIIRLTIKRIASYICYKKGDIGKALVTIDAIPRRREFFILTKPKEFFLFAIDENNKRKRYKYYSSDVLGMVGLDGRVGFMGYGNFLDSKYEIEYYKYSGVIKSMRLIQTGDGSASWDL